MYIRSLHGTQRAVTMASSKDSAHEGDWRGQLDKPEIKIDSFGRLILSLESGRLLASNQRAISFLFFPKTHPGVLLDQNVGIQSRGDSLFPQNWRYRGAADSCFALDVASFEAANEPDEIEEPLPVTSTYVPVCRRWPTRDEIIQIAL